MALAGPASKKPPRKPPTFQHLPEQRAKKLKKQWVLKQKIKSQWKAQKRKEGIVTPRDVRAAAAKAATKENMEGESKGGAAVEDTCGIGVDDATSSNSDNGSSDEKKPSPGKSHSPSNPKSSPYLPSKRTEGLRNVDEPAQSSYRELQRQAYSRESLHHFKSGRRGKSARDNFSASQSSGRNGRNGGKGSGQPDMRLRMGALLEKIKHTASDR